MTLRLTAIVPALVDLVLLWCCELVAFYLLPAGSAPLEGLLFAPTIIYVVFGVSASRAWRGNAIVAVATAALYFIVWSRGADAGALAVWYGLSVGWRAVRAGLERNPVAWHWWQRCFRPLQTLFLAITVKPPLAPCFRVGLLLVTGVLLMHSYLSFGIIGAGDAGWYANIVRDFLQQVRAGTFPVWLDQTEYYYLGGTLPLRLAPYLQHFAALIDLVTGQTLTHFRVLNLALVASLAGGLLSCYYCLLAVNPRQPWTAACLAFLYVSCPGVIGLAYAQDLYMSFMTLPYLPVVFLGIVRSFDRNDLLSRLLMAGGLGAAWLAHPPIAMWCAIIAFATQLVRLARLGLDRRTLLLDGLAAVTFVVLVQFSFVSVATIGPRWTANLAATSQLYFVHEAFPGNWLPVRRPIGLENLQFGYTLIVLLAGVLAWGARRRDFLTLLFASTGTVLALMLVPVPFVTSALWHLVPKPILNITNVWPTQRLLVLFALCTVFGAAAGLRKNPFATAALRWLAALVLIGGMAWSGLQVRQFIASTNPSAPSASRSAMMQRMENLTMTRSALGSSTVTPRYFSNGVVAPELEQHFLDRTTRELQSSATDSIAPGFGPGPKSKPAPLAGILTGEVDANPLFLDLSPTLRLEPGRHYLLLLDFLPLNYTGLLILRGSEFYREYALPLAGEPYAFGTGPECAHVIPLWTSLDHAETVQLQFLPTGEGAHPPDFTPFAAYELRAYENAQLPIQVESWTPYRAKVRTAGPVYLETSRFVLPGYQATVDGKSVPVDKSRDGLIIVPIEAGQHEVTLEYVPPLVLRISYWIGVAAWIGFLGATSYQVIKGRRNPLPAPTKILDAGASDPC